MFVELCFRTAEAQRKQVTRRKRLSKLLFLIRVISTNQQHLNPKSNSYYRLVYNSKYGIALALVHHLYAGEFTERRQHRVLRAKKVTRKSKRLPAQAVYSYARMNMPAENMWLIVAGAIGSCCFMGKNKLART